MMGSKFLLLVGCPVMMFLTACNPAEKNEASAPNIPFVSSKGWAEMSLNEFQEIERRCIGVKHPTCDSLPEGRESRERVAKALQAIKNIGDAVGR